MESYTRDCMWAADFHGYGLTPEWVWHAGPRHPEQWLDELPAQARPEASTALLGARDENGRVEGDWRATGCLGAAFHRVGAD
ncbi:hypothetical protein [Herbiconiux liukaitaii]|uniref:hypothetical protein n=1 Tax=Herbiconiux liukaitaii TaxID=3342799 RepID=UPI0035B9E06E